MYGYRISGLSIASDIELPGAIGCTPDDNPDVTVRFGAVPRNLAQPTATGPSWERGGDTILLSVPRLARFLISGGSSIVIALEDGASARDASIFVLGSSLGILLHQRGALVLHGAAVARDDRAIAFVGHSGAGKSTLCAAMCQKGYSFVTDDICVVSLDTNGEPVVLPDGRQLKLWKQSIDGLDLGERQGDAVRDTFEKYFVAPLDTVRKPPRLTAIYVLREAPHGSGIVKLATPDAMRMLEHVAYRPGLRQQLASPPQRLSQAVAVLNHASVFQLTRPLGFDALPVTLDALIRHGQEL